MPSRATIRDRVKYLPPTRISGVGETSGFDPATMKDQLIWSPRWPLLGSAPADVGVGQRFRLAEAGLPHGREYFGRSVVSALSGQNVTLAGPVANLKDNDFCISAMLRDVVSLDELYPTMIVVLNQFGAIKLNMWTVKESNGICVGFKQSDGGSNHFIASTTGVFHDGMWHSIRFGIQNKKPFIEFDGVLSTFDVNMNGWEPVSGDSIISIFASFDTSPFQVCNIQQSLNGVLIDNIPCTEVSGTALANTITPSRLATLSDANAHALAWVPQDDVTMGVWRSQSVFKSDGSDIVTSQSTLPYLESIATANGEVTLEAFCNPAVVNVYQCPVMWTLGGTDSNNFGIKARTNGTVWSMSGQTAPAQGNQVLTAGVPVRLVASRKSDETQISYMETTTPIAITLDPLLTGRLLVIGGYATDIEKWIGSISKVNIYAGYTPDGSVSGLTLLDTVDFSAWDGAATIYSAKGYAFSLIDGSPFTARSFEWVPL